MFHIDEIEVTNLWGKKNLKTSFNNTTIFIGQNGSGKTTLMNLIAAALTPNTNELNKIDFQTISIKLKKDSNTRTIKISKSNLDRRTSIIEYKISNTKYKIYIENFPPYRVHQRWMHVSYPNPSQNTQIRLRKHLSKLVKTTILSVHRLNYETVHDPMSDDSLTVMRPLIDIRLEELLQKLTKYQLSLSEKASKVSSGFQRDVLISMLFSEDFDTFTPPTGKSKVSKMKDFLHSAYEEIIDVTPEIKRQIEKHAEAVSRSLRVVQKKQRDGSFEINIDDALPFPLYKRTEHIIALSQKAQKEKKEIFMPIENLRLKVDEFFKNKNVILDTENGLTIHGFQPQLEMTQLSSGEKQILVLLIEALLQSEHSGIILIDEPELSLHIIWQEMIVNALRDLSPNSQLILATHSPEIAGSDVHNVVDMEDFTYGT